MQSESDAERIESLGVDRTKLFTAGNLKFDVGTVATSAEDTKELQQRFGISRMSLLSLRQVLTHPKKRSSLTR
jgi:3-deoxy-D-manno-octulosonic-acid transferase